MSTRSLLIELGCEELPSSSLKKLGVAMGEVITQKLDELKLEHGEVKWFAAPRRLAVHVVDLQEQAADEEQEALGPPADKARDDAGNWTKAAEGFAKRQNLEPEALEIIDTPKGPRLGIRRTVAGVRTEEVLLSIVESTVRELPVAKRMRWGSSRMEFARPIHWVVLMFGEQHGFGSVMGIASGNQSRGHRFHAPDPISIAHADDYIHALSDAKVVADFEARSGLIREQVNAVAASHNAQALIDEDLLDEVSSLVEWPVALSGTFDEEFLHVPAEALISSMQSHQKYFPVVDDKGDLLPRFITVSNIESKDPTKVIEGNEKVIRPRLADAAFFFEQDRQHSLESRLERLDAVVFQKQLGSLGDKSRRISQLAAWLADQLDGDTALAERAGRLCKADLVSDMVLEFADMQGIAGAHYARADGEDAAVADAIEQHYWPLGAGSGLPAGQTATCVALADRLDTLVGIFGIGQSPSGSKDPFALRRASIGILRMIIEQGLSLDLAACIERAQNAYPADLLDAASKTVVLDYLFDRLPALYEDSGIPVETFRAVRATGCTQPSDFAARLNAVAEFARTEAGSALAAANKRVGNILAKAEFSAGSGVNTALLQEAPEKALHEAIAKVKDDNASDLANARYQDALTRLAQLAAPVDAFFDGVMVNAEDLDLRDNRLSLLAELRAQFVGIADISLLA